MIPTPRFLAPRPTLSDAEVESGLKWLTRQGTVSMGFDGIATGGFMAAFAIALGANNTQIGILAALPFITQPLQIPAVILVEKLRKRKLISFIAAVLVQAIWVPIALIPVFFDTPSTAAIIALLAGITLRSLVTPTWNAAWMGWLKDLVPAPTRGRFFARRLARATALGMVLGLSGALFVDWWSGRDIMAQDQALGFTYVMLVAVFAIVAWEPFFISRIPEPLMQTDLAGRRSILAGLAEPVRDPNFRRLLIFKSTWALVINLAIPFFAVYMLRVLDMSVTSVMLLTALSQIANILFLRVWGQMVDRLGNKAIISVSSSLYLLVVLGWTFTTLPDTHALTLPMLVVFHILAGIAAAGLNVANGTIAMKLAAPGRETAYLAAASLAVNFGAGVGPLLGGQFADFFSTRSFRVSFDYISDGALTSLSPFHLTGFDFLFAIAFVLGLVVLGQLTLVREEGETDKDQVIEELLAPWRGLSRPMSSVPGLGLIAQYPLSYVTRAPIPGLDAALGVTAYQVAEAASAATRAAHLSREVASRLGIEIRDSVAEVLGATEQAGEHVAEISRHTARGAVHAASDISADLSHVVEATGRGLMRAVEQAGGDPEMALYGFGYGVAQAAADAGMDAGAASEAADAAAEQIAAEVASVDAETARALIGEGIEAAEREAAGESGAAKSVTPG